MIGAHPTISRLARANPFCSDRACGTTGAVRQILFALLALVAGKAAATDQPLGARDLSPRIRWTVSAVRIEGTDQISERTLRPLLATRARSFFTPWKARPRFEREGLEDDVTRLAAYYRGHGYYRARVTYTLDPDRRRDTVAVTIHIDEGPPVVVTRLEIDLLDDAALSDRPAIDPASLVPFGPGDVFDEAHYDEGRARLLGWARARHFARATVTKRARPA
jgi:outer membrane protein assembly factor BamA